ncbi:hypothetical protein CONLIGDRAFT_634378 [Coniochaeta ligniaria NRRL 30616]|uniref:Uncharacterized protein n=1 Tax=Coniochaeta ligniaria NRRL 30616 TaxID=1408157 RepID=A0A1J7JK65_9PEZI|nr:hypothetical protein CONLIGDRAFT_634378 [Coniochaeta ligniaria NRRL 30616]
MPPPIPRPSLCGLAGRTSASTTPRTATTSLRNTFSTTSSASQSPAAPRSSTRIPPESPRYISVPEPPQATLVRRPPVRGHLPVPREIFPRKTGDRKLAPDYVMRATPLSIAEESGAAPKNELEAWRRRMAHSRRSALSAGLKGLYDRKSGSDDFRARKTREKGEAHRRAATAPDRADDVLTRSTILASVAEQLAVREDPARFETARKSARRTAKLHAARAEARGDALSELYIAAKDFIVDETELARKVDELFDENYFSTKGVSDALSIWDTDGPPIKTSAMIDQQGYGRDNPVNMGYEMYQPDATRTARKQKIIAEELTGGKL